MRRSFKRNKKAIFYTLMGIILLILVVELIKPRTQLTVSVNDPAVSFAKIRSMNMFIKTIEYHSVPDMLKLSFYRALQSINTKINLTNKSYTSNESILKDINDSIIKGVITATSTRSIYNPYNISSVVKEIEWLANQTSLELTGMSVKIKNFYQDNSTRSFQIGLNYTLKFNLKSRGFAYWNVSKNSSIVIDLIGLRDPMDLLNKGSIPYVKRIKYPTTLISYYGLAYTGNENGLIYLECAGKWYHDSCFADQINLSRYDSNSNSSSYIQRLKNETNAQSRCCGLITPINIKEYKSIERRCLNDNGYAYFDKCLVNASLPGCSGDSLNDLVNITHSSNCGNISKVISPCHTFLLSNEELGLYNLSMCSS